MPKNRAKEQRRDRKGQFADEGGPAVSAPTATGNHTSEPIPIKQVHDALSKGFGAGFAVAPSAPVMIERTIEGTSYMMLHRPPDGRSRSSYHGQLLVRVTDRSSQACGDPKIFRTTVGSIGAAAALSDRGAVCRFDGDSVVLGDETNLAAADPINENLVEWRSPGESAWRGDPPTKAEMTNITTPVRACLGRDEARPVLTHALLSGSNQGEAHAGRFVSTDSWKLASVEPPVEVDVPDEGVMIPGIALNKLAAAIRADKSSNDQVGMFIKHDDVNVPATVTFEVGDVSIQTSTATTPDQYPKFNRLFPKDASEALVFDQPDRTLKWLETDPITGGKPRRINNLTVTVTLPNRLDGATEMSFMPWDDTQEHRSSAVSPQKVAPTPTLDRIHFNQKHLAEVIKSVAKQGPLSMKLPPNKPDAKERFLLKPVLVSPVSNPKTVMLLMGTKPDERHR